MDMCGACEGIGLHCYESEGAVMIDDNEYCGVCEGKGMEERDPMRPQTWLEARNAALEAEWGWMRNVVRNQPERLSRADVLDSYSDDPAKYAWARENYFDE